MTDLEIGMTLSTAILFVAIGVMFVIWFHQNKEFNYEIKKLRQSLSTVKASYLRLKQQSELDEIRHATAMNTTLYMWREEVDELKAELARKEQLLQQKWKGATENVSE